MGEVQRIGEKTRKDRMREDDRREGLKKGERGRDRRKEGMGEEGKAMKVHLKIVPLCNVILHCDE